MNIKWNTTNKTFKEIPKGTVFMDDNLLHLKIEESGNYNDDYNALCLEDYCTTLIPPEKIVQIIPSELILG